MSGPAAPRLSPAEREERDALIARLGAEGVAAAGIADRVGVTDRHVRRVLARQRPAGPARDVPAVRDLEPVDVSTLDPALELGGLLALLRWTEDELRRLASTTRNDAVRVAALRSVAATARDRLRLTGDRLSVFRGIGDLERFGRIAIDVLVEEAGHAGLDVEAFGARVDEEIRARAAGELNRTGVDFDGFAPRAAEVAS